jgi:hypothetical protein
VPDPPPRDAAGNVIPHDHPDIHADHVAIRRISENFIVPDGSGGRRISSMAFRPSSGVNGGMSVDLESFILESGQDPRAFVTTPLWRGSVCFQVGVLRGEGLQVGYHPMDGNKFHGEVWGATKRSQQKRLQDLAAWYVPIPGVQIA